MPNFNRVILGGNLTRDPELRYTPKGTAVCAIDIAINRTWKNEVGETKEEVTFVNVSCFGRTAENIGQYFRKGKPILIEGRLSLDQWDDKQTGQKRTKLKVIMESFQFCGGDKPEGGGDGGRPDANSRRADPHRKSKAAQPDAEEPPADDYDSDVPF